MRRIVPLDVGALDVGVDAVLHALADRPLCAGIVLRLDGAERAHNVLRCLEGRADQSLVVEAQARDIEGLSGHATGADDFRPARQASPGSFAP